MENNYYKTSHFKDMVKNMSNKPNKDIPYTDKQFEEDLKKWVIETKTIQNDKVKQFEEFLKKWVAETKTIQNDKDKQFIKDLKNNSK